MVRQAQVGIGHPARGDVQPRDGLVDPDADNKAADADEALQELGADDVAFGYLTTSIVVADSDAKQANEKLLAIERIINGRGFVAIRET